MVHFTSILGLLVCSSSLASGLALPHSSGKVIEPRYIIPGHNTTCQNHICPESQTAAPRKSESSASSSPGPSKVVHKPERIPTRPREAVCPDTGLPYPCKPIKHVPAVHHNKTSHRTHQTAPVKCGDTGLPPPCKAIKHVPGFHPESKIPPTHQTAPVKCGGTGLPPPCKEPVKNITHITPLGQQKVASKSD